MRACVALALLGTALPARAQRLDPQRLDVQRLAPLPEPLGVAGACAGVSHGMLIVAGGAHFPVPLTAGGTKVWTPKVHVAALGTDGTLAWKPDPAPLDGPRGYSASATWHDAVLCIGGGDARRHVRDVLVLRWNDGRLRAEHALPPLPQTVAFASAARVGDTLYVAGGLAAPDDSTSLRTFWSLDLTSPSATWRALPPWPGPGRYDAVAAAFDGAFYLFSGVELDGSARRFLRDAYRYRPSSGWERLADLPWSVAAAPSPGIATRDRLLVLGGNDGVLAAQARELGDRHPGFRHQVLAYDTRAKRWAVVDSVPAAHVNTPVVSWGATFIVPSGEVRPGVRTPDVLRVSP